jgi:uncharacterized repeat protein (TIGR01451 family)/gliding motility-associated-like protein
MVCVSPLSYGQDCDAWTPHFNVDLSSNADSLWQSTSVSRLGNCCDTESPDRCIHFTLTLSPNTQAILFTICEGAEPSGALYYQVDCGPEIPVGEPFCIEGVGPHEITFCKPGSNKNRYCIKSLPFPSPGPDLVLGYGCTDSLTTIGYKDSSTVWTSISPGNIGDYDHLLSCSQDCAQTSITNNGSYTGDIQYQVCGFNVGGCDPLIVCDTILVSLLEVPNVTINVDYPKFCATSDTVILTTTITGFYDSIQYIWNTGETADAIIGTPGDYWVEVIDNVHCLAVRDSATVDANDPLVVSFSKTSLKCNGDDDAQAAATVSGGNPPYQVLWSTGATSNSIANLSAGNYWVEITDSKNCIERIEFEVTEPDELQVICNIDNLMSSAVEEDGQISVTGSGGTLPYTYLWDTGDTTSVISNLGEGTYNVIVTDANGCQDTCFATMKVVGPVDNPDLDPNCHMDVIFILDESSSITGSNTAEDISLKIRDASYAMLTNLVGTDTRVRVIEFNRTARRGVVGGSTAYQLVDATSLPDFQAYLYNNPNDGNATASYYDPEDNVGQMGWTNWEDAFNEVEAINSVEPISPIVIMITDGNPTSYNNNSGGTTSGTSAAITTQALSNAVGAANAVKLQGSHVFIVGQPNPTLDEGNLQAVSGPDRYPDMEPDFRKGDYAITSSDNLEQIMAAIGGMVCSSDLRLEKTVDRSLVCNANDTVVFYITVTNDGIETATNVQVKDSIPSGYNYVTNSDVGNTSLIGDLLFWNIDSIQMDNSYTLQITMTVNAAGDYKNVAQVSASDLRDDDSEPNNDDGDQSEDDEDYAEVSISTLGITMSMDSIDCYNDNDGIIAVQVSDGNQPYSYLWNTGETSDVITGKGPGWYSVVVTDSIGCSLADSLLLTQPDSLYCDIVATNIQCFGGQNGSLSLSINGGVLPYAILWNTGDTLTYLDSLDVGTYNVNITDANGCNTFCEYTITQPDSLTLVLSQDSVNCYQGTDGSASVVATGGKPGYTYLWNTGETVDNIANKSAGTYSVTVTDSNNCVKQDTIIILEPTALQLVLTQDSVDCYQGVDGSASVLATGGSPEYSYLWSTGETVDNITGKATGTYTVIVMDKNGCDKTDSIIILEPTELQITLSQDSVSCYQGADGTVSVVAIGGTPGYTYLWSTGETVDNITGKATGAYAVTVTDNNGCEKTDSIVILEPSKIIIDAYGTPVSCYGGNDGGAFITVSGSNGGYVYDWSPTGLPGDTSLQDLTAGDYYVLVTDIKGCNDSTTITITQPDSLTLVLSQDSVNCYQGTDGSASVLVTGDTLGYTYLWNTGETVDNITGKAAGMYSVTVTDSNGCSKTDSIIVLEPEELLFSVTYDYTICQDDIVNMYFMLEGGTSPYRIQINGEEYYNDTIQLLYDSLYVVHVTDKFDCSSGPEEIRIRAYTIDSNIVSLSASETSFCEGNIATINASINGNYETYEWNISSFNVLDENQLVITKDTTVILTVKDTCGFDIEKRLELDLIERPIMCNILLGDSICSPINKFIVDTCSVIEDFTARWYVDDVIETGAFGNSFHFVRSVPETYRVRREVVTNNKCAYTYEEDSVYVVFPSPNVDFELLNDKLDTRNPQIETINMSSGVNSWKWDFGDNRIDSLIWEPKHNYNNVGQIVVTLVGENEYGCIDRAQRDLEIELFHDFDIPTGFKPSGSGGSYISGQNDVFYVIADRVEEFHMMIFNRWGEIVFESFDINIGWDGIYKGEISQQDVYVYKVYLTFIDGYQLDQVGSFTLIR